VQSRVRRAKVARARFEEEKPLDTPVLPLSDSGIRKMENAPDALSRAVAHYARSLRANHWRAHPSFQEYVNGLSASSASSEAHIRDLVRRAGLKVNPQPLAGHYMTYWRPPESTVVQLPVKGSWRP
jgi:hypothetical protein